MFLIMIIITGSSHISDNIGYRKTIIKWTTRVAYCKSRVFSVSLCLKYRCYNFLFHFQIGGIIACGVFLLIVSIGGLYATIRHHQVLLFFYMVILFVLFIIQFSVACACLAVSEGTQRQLAEQGWRNVGNETKDTVQHQLSCCGYYNLTIGGPLGHPLCDDVVCDFPSRNCSQSTLYQKVTFTSFGLILGILWL